MLATYSSRIDGFSNPAARTLLQIMEHKKTNLCVSVDVSSKLDVLRIVDAVGPHVCLIKVAIPEKSILE
jgi:orotidine-5'-phosphate decarboxylase